MRPVCFLDRTKIYTNLTDFILSVIPENAIPFGMAFFVVRFPFSQTIFLKM